MVKEVKLNKEFYNNKFYEKQARQSFESANEVLKVLFEIYKPTSIVDFGCGQGTWLAGAEKFGVKKLKGYDGVWVDKNRMYSKNIDFEQVNLEREIQVENKFDMAISLEVAEHLSPASARKFIDSICNASNIVLFSAAIEDQGGTNHINTQWQTYWIDLFEQNNFKCFDIIRPQIWENEKVEHWYRQNIFLFVNENSKELKNIKANANNCQMLNYNIVHPGQYKRKVAIIKKKDDEICKYKKLLNECKK